MSAWKILKDAVSGYIAHEALTRGAAIAFYAVTSLAPILLVVVAVAGLVFGQDVVRSNLIEQVSGLVGREGGELVKTMLTRASDKESSTWASLLGVLTVVVTASGVFGEMQAALNRTWDVRGADQPWFSLIRARAASPQLGGRTWLPSLGFACRQRSYFCIRQLHGKPRQPCISVTFGRQYAHLAVALHRSFRSDLQGFARYSPDLA
jgi:hypothetical protein